ncbi:MAG: hypothetical protein Q4B60_08920 [Erysipelotrichaceae bacterium]|nr:hypothetical protein [Erysipelotrichaceae bacterium]
MIKKLLVIMMLLGMFGCSPNEKLVSLKDYYQYDFNVSEVNELECVLGSGASLTIYNNSHIEEVLNTLNTITIDTNKVNKDLSIEDGDIGFIFISDSNRYIYWFSTTEYLNEDNKLIEVKDRDTLKNLLNRVREMEETAVFDEIEFEHIDNGCEARDVLIISYKDQEVILEGVYEITDKFIINDELIISCQVGDYYSHETIKDFVITINNKTLEVEPYE